MKTVKWIPVDSKHANYEIRGYFWGGEHPKEDAEKFARDDEEIFRVDVELAPCRFVRAWAVGREKQ